MGVIIVTLRERIIDEPKLEKHITVFLDILGSSASLLELDQAVENKASENRVEFLKEKALYPAQRLRLLIDSAYEGIRSTKNMTDHVSNLTPEEIKVLKEAVMADAHYQSSSDSLLLFVSVSDEYQVRCMSSLLDMLHVISYASFCMLAYGHAIRGAISIGWGAKILDDEILGAGIVKSHELEKRRARYPRIIVDDEVVLLISQALELRKIDLHSKLSRHIAQLCQKMIYDDCDGEHVVDFWSSYALKHAPKESLEQLNTRASLFVRSSLTEVMSKRDLSLIMKYSWLMHYILVRSGADQKAVGGAE